MAENHNASYKRQVVMDHRRAMIAELLVKRPGITQRQIYSWLAEVVDVKGPLGESIGSAPRLVNPETRNPFSLGTVNDDIKYVRKLWQTITQKNAAEWLAMQLAALQEAEAIAWRKKDTSEVRAIWTQRNKILGLDAPLKIARTDSKGNELVEPDVITVFVYNDAYDIQGAMQQPEPDGRDDSTDNDG